MTPDNKQVSEAVSLLRAIHHGEPFSIGPLQAAAESVRRAYEELYDRFKPRPMQTAPTDGTVIFIQTNDGCWLEGYWDAEQPDFYKSDPYFAGVYDSENCMGTWVAVYYSDESGDHRLYCGMTPAAWMPRLPTAYFDDDGMAEEE